MISPFFLLVFCFLPNGKQMAMSYLPDIQRDYLTEKFTEISCPYFVAADSLFS